MEHLKELRRLAGWTQTRTSARSGVNRAKLSMAECGEVCLDTEEEAAVRRVLLLAVGDRAVRIESVLARARTEPVSEAPRTAAPEASQE